MNAQLTVMKMFNKIWPRNGECDYIEHLDHGGFLDLLLEPAQPLRMEHPLSQGEIELVGWL